MPVPTAEETNGRASMSGKTSSAAKRSSSSKTAETRTSYTHSSSIWVAPLVFLCPFFVMVFSYTILKLDGSLALLLQEVRQKGAGGILYSAWVPYLFGSAKAWKILLPYIVFQLSLMKIFSWEVDQRASHANWKCSSIQSQWSAFLPGQLDHLSSLCISL